MAELMQRINSVGDASADYTALEHPLYVGPKSRLPLTCATLAGEVFVAEHTADQSGLPSPDPTDPENNQVNY